MSQAAFKWIVPLVTLVITLALVELAMTLFFPVPYAAEKTSFLSPMTTLGS